MGNCTGLDAWVPEPAAAAENEPPARLASPGATGSGGEEVNVDNCGSSSTVRGTDNIGEKPQIYIEVDATAMVNIKAGTEYTLVPVDSDVVTEAAVNSIPAADMPPQQPLEWNGTTDDRMAEQQLNGNEREAVSKEQMQRDSYGLEQSVMNGFEPAAIAVTKSEVPDESSELDTDYDSGDKITYTPLMAVPQPQHEQQQPQQTAVSQPSHEAATAASHMQHNTGGYDEMPYRHPTSPMFVASSQHALQHQSPFLVHSRASWAPFSGTSHSQASTGAAGGASGGLGAGTSNGGPAGADSGLHAVLGGDDGPSNGDFGRGASGDAAASELMGVARVANMGQLQHMVGPLDSVPYYMPFNGRENHNEKERKRRTRIKNACQTLRSLVPGLSEKTDKATVFEFTVQYLVHLRRHIGSKQDKAISQEFMEKYSPY